MRKQRQIPATASQDGWKNSLCAKCPAICCSYITIQIDEPRDEQDLDNLRWYLIHDWISILVEDQQWFVKIDTPCRHLRSDYRCAIYDKRPEACRQYDTETCDYRTEYQGWDAAYRQFVDFERLHRYIKQLWARTKRGGVRRRASR